MCSEMTRGIGRVLLLRDVGVAGAHYRTLLKKDLLKRCEVLAEYVTTGIAILAMRGFGAFFILPLTTVIVCTIVVNFFKPVQLGLEHCNDFRVKLFSFFSYDQFCGTWEGHCVFVWSS